MDDINLEIDDWNYPFPTPDWFISNASWAAEQLEIYKGNRTGKPPRYMITTTNCQ